MKKNYVMMRMFSVNNKIVMAQNFDEAISIYRERKIFDDKDKEIKSAYECRDGEFCYVKIATEEDYIATHGKKD